MMLTPSSYNGTTLATCQARAFKRLYQILYALLCTCSSAAHADPTSSARLSFSSDQYAISGNLTSCNKRLTNRNESQIRVETIRLPYSNVKKSPEEMRYVGLFGLSPTKYLNEDSQTLGNKNPSLHRKAAELQPRRPPEGRLQSELRQL